MANPCLESVKPSAVWHSHSFLLSLPPTLVARRLYSLSQNIGSSNILIPFLKTDFLLYCSCSSVFYAAVTGRIMLLGSKWRQEHCLDQIASDEGCKEPANVSLCARQISPSPFLALMDVHCSALKTDGRGIRTGSSETGEVKLLSLTFQYSL